MAVYRVSENPKAKHIQGRESFVVVRPYRKGEKVRAKERMFVDRNELLDY